MACLPVALEKHCNATTEITVWTIRCWLDKLVLKQTQFQYSIYSIDMREKISGISTNYKTGNIYAPPPLCTPVQSSKSTSTEVCCIVQELLK